MFYVILNICNNCSYVVSVIYVCVIICVGIKNLKWLLCRRLVLFSGCKGIYCRFVYFLICFVVFYNNFCLYDGGEEIVLLSCVYCKELLCKWCFCGRL